MVASCPEDPGDAGARPAPAISPAATAGTAAAAITPAVMIRSRFMFDR
jgi:hypothetical protein